MRPIRITGVVGNSVPVPLDVYTIGNGGIAAIESTGAGEQMQWTPDDPFTIAAGNLTWFNLGAAVAGSAVQASIPPGARAIRCTGMVIADTLVVSQQGIR